MLLVAVWEDLEQCKTVNNQQRPLSSGALGPRQTLPASHSSRRYLDRSCGVPGKVAHVQAAIIALLDTLVALFGAHSRQDARYVRTGASHKIE